MATRNDDRPHHRGDDSGPVRRRPRCRQPARPAPRRRRAPPGHAADFLPSDKAGFGTSTTRGSHVWFTLQPGGGTGEIYYPTLGSPAARRLGFVVTGPNGYAVRVDRVGSHHVTLTDAHSLTFRQVDTGPKHAWQLRTTYVTDPAHNALRIGIHFNSLDGTAVPAVRAVRADAVELDLQRFRTHPRERARRLRRACGKRPPGPTGIHRHVERLPRHQRRLARPARQRPARPPLHVRPERQPRADRADVADRPARPSRRRAHRRLRRLADRGAAHRPGRCGRDVRRDRRRLRARLACLPGRPAPAARLAAQHAGATRVPRLGDGPCRVRGQDPPRRVRRVADHALGMGRREEPDRPVSPRVVTRSLPDRDRADRRRRPGRGEPRTGLPVRPATEVRRLVPAELHRRRQAVLGRPATGRGGRPDRAGLPTAPGGPRLVAARQGSRRFPARLPPGRLRRPVHPAGPLGEPERLLPRHHRQRDRRTGLRGVDRPAQRGGRGGPALSREGRLVAGAREGLDGHRQRPVLVHSGTSCG